MGKKVNGDATAAVAEPKKEKGERTMNLVLIRELSEQEIQDMGITAGKAPGQILEVLADESAGLRDQNDVTKWMEKSEFSGDLFVLAFRKGQGKQEGRHGRLRRRRFKPEPTFVVE